MVTHKISSPKVHFFVWDREFEICFCFKFKSFTHDFSSTNKCICVLRCNTPSLKKKKKESRLDFFWVSHMPHLPNNLPLLILTNIPHSLGRSSLFFSFFFFLFFSLKYTHSSPSLSHWYHSSPPSPISFFLARSLKNP